MWGSGGQLCRAKQSKLQSVHKNKKTITVSSLLSYSSNMITFMSRMHAKQMYMLKTFALTSIHEPLHTEAGHFICCLFMCMLLYLRDQQLYVLLKAVQESLQGAGVGSAALPSPNFRQP